MKTKYYVENMTCAACQSHVENRVSKIKGVKSVVVNLLTTEMFVESDAPLDKKIEKALNEIGYKLVYEKASDKVSNKAIKLIISGILGLILLYLSMGHMIGLKSFSFMNNKAIEGMIELAITIPIIILNYKYFLNGFKKLFLLLPNMDSLIAIGSTASFVYSIYLLIRILLEKNYYDSVHFYFDSSAMILVLVSLGKYLESKSKNKTQKAITKLMDLSPKECIVFKDGEEQKIATNDLKIGDIVILKQGDVLPIDGVVCEGIAMINESNITGESMPLLKEEDDEIISSSYVLSGYIKVKVTKEFEDSTINKIIRLVNEASNSKAKVSHLVDRVSGKFTYFVIIISLISFITFMFLENFKFALNIGISVLVVSCPCALGLATPLCIMVGTGVSAKKGILLKNAEVLENLSKVKTVVLDKTGTITYGRHEVVETNLDDKALQIIYSLESLSSHPLATAICEFVKGKNIKPLEVTNFENIEGVGVSGYIDGIKYTCGNLRSLNFTNITKGLIDEIESDSKKGVTSLLLTTTDLIGIIKMTDVIKPTSKDAISYLHKEKINVVMLTGDKKEIAKKVGNELNIDEIYAEVMPQDKQEIIKNIKKNSNGFCAMTGDGVNDAIALMEADVGISVGKGTDIAIDSSDVVLLNDDLLSIVDIIKLSKKIMNTIKVNLFWAFFYNIIGISFASGLFYYKFGILMNPIICALSMAVSSLFVTINSLSINLYKGVKIMNKLVITNMNCAHCVKRIEEALTKIKGLEFVVNLEEKSVTLNTTDDKLINKAIKAIKKAGYEIK